MAGSASPFSTIYAFGDSLSDGGNDSILTSATGTEPVSPPYYHTNIPILDGLASESASVFSNGPVWVQDLSQALGLGTLEPSLLGGNDFAYGGAETGSTPQNMGNDTISAINLPSQLSQFSAVSESGVPTALFTVSIGGNDIFDILANTTLTASQQATDVSDAVANEVSAINTMIKDGGKNFLIFNVPNLGLVPEVTLGKANGSNTPSAAEDALATSLSAAYDTQLAAALGTIEAGNAVSIKTLDSFSLLTDASQDPSAFGLTNTTTPVWSGNFTSASSGTLAVTTAAAQAQYLFWDDFHPTAAVHQILANNAQTLLSSAAADQATVAGAANATVTLTLASTQLATQIQTQLTQLSIAVSAGTVAATAAAGGTTLPTPPGSETGLAQITTGGFVALPGNYGTAINVAATATTLVETGTGNQLVVDGGAGGMTYVATSGADTIYGGSGGDLVFGGSATLNFYGGSGAATIIGGTGGTNNVAGGLANQLIFAGSGLSYAGGAGAATIIGGSAPLNAAMGAGGGVAFGSVGGADTLSAGGGTAVLVGYGTGDVLTATGTANDTLVAGAGAQTLNGSGSSGNLVFFGGTGADSMTGGSGSSVFLAGAGNETLTGSTGSNQFIFSAVAGTTRTDVITNFNPATSAIGLVGYGTEPGADNAALASAAIVGGNTTVRLSDGSSIVFNGAPTLHSYNFY